MQSCVKDFTGARIWHIQDYVQPALRENTGHIVLHVVTNDLATNIPTEEIAESLTWLPL